MRARGVRAGAHVRAGILLMLAALLLLSVHVGVWWVSGAASAPRGERPRGARDKVASWLERVATGAARLPVLILSARDTLEQRLRGLPQPEL